MSRMSAKTYAMWGGIIFLVIGVLGLVNIGVSNNKFIGLLNSDTLEDLIHIVVGAILAYFGFRGTDAQAANWAMIFGVVFLVVGVVGFLLPTLFGLIPSRLGAIDNIVHLAYGAVGVWAGRAYKPGM